LIALAFAFLPNAKAVTIAGLATLAQTGASSGSNTYVITLQNTSTPGTSLETFWFAWIPGQNYLDTSPISVQTPAGWTDSITHGGSSDGYAIHFNVTSPSFALASSDSLSGFGLTTADTLAQLEGDSNFYPSTPVLTSEVSTSSGFGGPFSASFVVTAVPEPGSSGLLAGGLCIVLWNLRRRGRA
jgi:hypothetical protein